MSAKYPKNMLVVYPGGGYDGCVWEWNAGFFDAKREFVQIRATGSGGVRNAETLYERYIDNRDGARTRHSPGDNLRITCRKDMLFLDREYASPLVILCVKTIQEYYTAMFPNHPDTARLQARMFCTQCGAELGLEEGEEYRLVGLVSSSGRCSGPFYYEDRICIDCFDKGQCRACAAAGCNDEESYWGEDQLDERGYCEHYACFALLEPLEQGLVWPAEETAELLLAYRKATPYERSPECPIQLNLELYKALKDHYQEHGLAHVRTFPLNNPPAQWTLPLS